MEAIGLLEPDDPLQSHHIVPRGGPMNGRRDPSVAQSELLELGMDVDALENGVPLSRHFHQKLHTSTYYRFVNTKLEGAGSYEEMARRLQTLRAVLIEADKAFQKDGTLPSWISGEVE